MLATHTNKHHVPQPLTDRLLVARRHLHLMQLAALKHWRCVARSQQYAAIAVTSATARRDGERCFQPAECFFLERMTVETLQQQSLHTGYTP